MGPKLLIGGVIILVLALLGSLGTAYVYDTGTSGQGSSCSSCTGDLSCDLPTCDDAKPCCQEPARGSE